MRKCSASLAIREIQIKTRMRYHLTPVRMGKINKAGNHKCCRGCGERGTPLHCWWGCELVQSLWKTEWRVLRVKNRFALGPSNCTAGVSPQRYRCSEMAGHLHPVVSSSNVHNSQTVEGASVSIERWMDKEDVVYICTMEYYSAIRKGEYPPFASTWMELEGIMLSEVSQSEKDKHYMVSFIWGI